MTPPMTTREKTADHAELAAKAERCTTGDPWYKDEDLRGRQSFGQFLPQDRAFIVAASPATFLALLSEIAALKGERDEADRRAGAAERELVGKTDSISKRENWLRKAKEARGYHQNVSFDRVWAETCDAADRATQAERQRDELRKAMPDLSSVIAWLDNGCDPKHAVTELGIYKARIDQAQANQGADQ